MRGSAPTCTGSPLARQSACSRAPIPPSWPGCERWRPPWASPSGSLPLTPCGAQGPRSWPGSASPCRTSCCSGAGGPSAVLENTFAAAKW
eukprot:9942487-Lingulodinium_polyedra.AAC.1